MLQMLIYFFSDESYHQEGFEAIYVIQDCPHDCSSHGKCVNNECQCYAGYWGDYCQLKICPNYCHPNGKCDVSSKSAGCICNEGYAGLHCDLSLNDDVGNKLWYLLSSSGSGFIPRTSHSGVFVESSNSLWVFGGYTGNGVLNDLSKFCLNQSRWERVAVKSNWPSSRSGHAATEFGDGFFMYGGVSEAGDQNDELWYFSTISENWTLKAINSSIRPPKLTGHSLTRMEDWIYLFGGRTENGTFSSAMFKINATLGESWEYVSVRGGKEEKRRLIGHSIVYHKESKSFLIFGGYTTEVASFGQLTRNLHAFHIEDQYWSEIEYFKTSHVPGQRAFHSAVIFGNYMVIYGGNAHQHHEVEVCYDSSLYLYHLGCHVWANNISISSGKFTGSLLIGIHANSIILIFRR